MVFIYLACIIIMGVLDNWFYKIYSDKYGNSNINTFLFSTCWMLTAAILFAALKVFKQSSFLIDYHDIILAFPMAICFTLITIFYILSIHEGPLSIALMISTSGIIIPCISGPLFFREVFGLKQIIGVSLIIVAAFIIVNVGEERKKNINAKYILYLFLTFVFNGSIMFIQKLYPYVSKNGKVEDFLMITFALGGISSLIIAIFEKSRGRITEKIRFKEFIIPFMGTAACMCGINKLSIYVSAYIPAYMQFPTQTGSVLILSTAMAVILFGEKFTLQKLTGIVLGVVAIILLN